MIGVDLDNTIVRYDELLRAEALRRKLIPESLPASKQAVRDWLRRAGQEDDWTELQGCVYGPRMRDAGPFPGALEFFVRCRELAVPVCIISHRTRFPYRGESHDLHQAARDWLAANGICDPHRAGLGLDRVYLELTKQDKLARIGQLACSHFIDDLPEFLGDPAFPHGVRKILFDPAGACGDCAGVARAASWREIQRLIFGTEA